MYTVILMTPENGFALLQYNDLISAQAKYAVCERAMPWGCCALFLYAPSGSLVKRTPA